MPSDFFLFNSGNRNALSHDSMLRVPLVPLGRYLHDL